MGTIQVFSQEENSESDYKKIYSQILQDQSRSAQEMVVYADSLKSAAKNNRDVVYADLILATAYIHTTQEAKAIEVIQEAHDLAAKSGLHEEKIMAMFHLKDAYRKFQLEEKRKEIIHQISKEVEDLERNDFYYSVKADNFLDLASINKENHELYEKFLLDAHKLFQQHDFSGSIKMRVLNNLGSYYHDQKKYDEAEKYFRELLKFNKEKYNNSIVYLVVGNLNLAHIFNLKKEFEKASSHLEISENLIDKHDLSGYAVTLKKIQTDYLRGIGDLNKENALNRELLELSEQVSDSTKKAIEQVIKFEKFSSEEEKKALVEKKNQNIFFLLGFSIVCLLFALWVFFMYKRYKKQKSKAFNKLIEKLELLQNSKEIPLVSIPVEKEIKTKDKTGCIEIGISEEKELEILHNLEEFEKGEAFTDNQFSLSSLAAHLNTNTKYLSFVLKKHRGEGYSDYINRIRIEYIAKRMYNEPELLKYKITHLAELAGFSSHSRFTQIFKKETNLSPSAFIEKLQLKK